MELTSEEEKVFKEYISLFDEDALIYYGDISCFDRGLTDSYKYDLSNTDIVKTTYNCINRILSEVAKRRNIEIPEFDIDELLKKVYFIPNELSDFNVLDIKEKNKLSDYINSKTRNNSNLENFNFLFSKISESFNQYQFKYINEMLNSDFLKKLIIENNSENGKTNNVSDEQIIDFIRYIRTYDILAKYQNNVINEALKLEELNSQLTLQSFYSNNELIENLERIMSHDSRKHRYYFHGTQCVEDADKIINEGFGMLRKDLESTSYPELSQNQLLLYKRGYAEEIGRDAIVIIDQPIEEGEVKEDVVHEYTDDLKINASTGISIGSLGKIGYVVKPKDIVGYIDKKNKRVIFNPRYHDYFKLSLKVNDSQLIGNRTERGDSDLKKGETADSQFER